MSQSMPAAIELDLSVPFKINDCSCDICVGVNAFLAHTTQTSHEVLRAAANTKHRKHLLAQIDAVSWRDLDYSTHSYSVRLMKTSVQAKKKQGENRRNKIAAFQSAQTYFQQLLAKVPSKFMASTSTGSGSTGTGTGSSGGGGGGGGAAAASNSGGGKRAAPATAFGSAAAAAGAGKENGAQGEVLIDLTDGPPPAKRSKPKTRATRLRERVRNQSKKPEVLFR